MLVIELQFPAGRYHATPWGRNVNEGETEWPPSPYRLARALVDVWKRRRPDWPESMVQPLLEALSGRVRFALPDARFAHTRSYLSSNEPDPSRKQLVFDPFVALDRGARILVGFEKNLAPSSLEDLNDLLDELNYFGRSESWIRACLAQEDPEMEWNCIPSGGVSAPGKEAVRVACLLPPEEYKSHSGWPPKRDWFNSLCLTTKELLDEGWSDPPALQWVDFLRPAPQSAPIRRRTADTTGTQFRYAKYALSSRVLPRVQETVPFAERIRSHLMGIHKRIKNSDPALVSPVFSGKNREGNPLQGHRHAFYLPLDEDVDGSLDHLLVFAAEPFDKSELKALDSLTSVWQPDRRPDVRFVLVSLSFEIPALNSTRWVSATPFVTSRHYRKGRGAFADWLNEEIRKECIFHGFPAEPDVRWIPHTLHTGHPIRWPEFIRRKKGDLPLHGYGCMLTFKEPVAGPMALGSGCHFGLGLFVPMMEEYCART